MDMAYMEAFREEMRAGFKAVNQRLDKLEVRMEKLEQRMDKLEERMDKLEQRMEKLEERMEKLEERMDKLEERMDKLEERMEKLEERMEKLEERMDKLEERMDRLEERMDRLEERMDRLEERMDRLEERMDRLEERMDKLEARTDGVEVVVGQLREAQSDGQMRLARVEQGLYQLSEKIDAGLIQARSYALDGFKSFDSRVENYWEHHESLKKRLDDLERRVALLDGRGAASGGEVAEGTAENVFETGRYVSFFELMGQERPSAEDRRDSSGRYIVCQLMSDPLLPEAVLRNLPPGSELKVAPGWEFHQVYSGWKKDEATTSSVNGALPSQN
jgi:predicted  nucleic acid-binding Zn-ribbon protein